MNTEEVTLPLFRFAARSSCTKRDCPHPSIQSIEGEGGRKIALFCPRCRLRFRVRACAVCTADIIRAFERLNLPGRPRLMCSRACQRDRRRLRAKERRELVRRGIAVAA